MRHALPLTRPALPAIFALISMSHFCVFPVQVSRLVLIDAGGESYKAPPPEVVSAVAFPANCIKTAFQFVQSKLDDDASRKRICTRSRSLHHSTNSPAMCATNLWLHGELRLVRAGIVSLHRSQPGCFEAGLAYLRSGSLAKRVGPERIRMVKQPTLVVWGTNDDILPLSDAYDFQRDLNDCVAVVEIEGAGHSPHLDQPEPVIQALRAFVLRR